MDATTDLLECSICTEPFSDARFLKCVHTFCVDCLQKMATSNNTRYITCPTCRTETDLPLNGVSDLPHNFYVNKMREALHVKQADSCKEHEKELLEVTTMLESCQEENERLNVKIIAKDKEIASNLLRKELKKGRRRIEVLEAQVTSQKEKDKYIQTLLTEQDKHRNEIEKTKRELNMKKVELKVQVSLCGQVQKQLEELQKEIADSKKQQCQQIQKEVADSKKQQCQRCKVSKQNLHVKRKECKKLKAIAYKKTEECRNLCDIIIQKIEKCSKLIKNISGNFDNCKELPVMFGNYCSRCHNYSRCYTTLIRIEFCKLSHELNCIVEETNHIKEQFKYIREQLDSIIMIGEKSNVKEIEILLAFLFSMFCCIIGIVNKYYLN